MASQDYYNGAPQGASYGPESSQALTQPPPDYGPDKHGYDRNQGGKETFDQAFKVERPRYNDLWAGILFILTVLGFVAISGISIHSYVQNSSSGIYDNGNAFVLNSNTLALFGFVLVVAFGLSWGYLMAARLFTKQFIWITGILNIVFGIATAVYYLYRHYWSAGIVFAVFAVFSIICFITWIPRIPFSVLMLQTTIDVAKNFGHVFIASAVGGLIALAFAAWFSVTLVAVYVKFQPASSGCSSAGGSCSYATVIGVMVFITFAGYWISEWLKNTLHVTIAGVYGSWFFCGNSMPRGPTRGAFRRAVTYSFGSVSFGSLVVALINMLRQIVSIAQQQEAGEGNIAASIAFCVLGCIISIIDWAVQFINRYAFSYIALYGKSYIEAARDTWSMMRDRGIDALVNDCLVGPVLSMGSTFVSFVCALLVFLYLEFTHPAYNSTGAYTPVLMAYSFLIGLQVCQIFMAPISSGLDTLFVAMAWDPQVLMRDHPDLYQRMIHVYPRVQQAIHA